MNILQFYEKNFKNLNIEQKKFWSEFYNEIWTQIMANISESFSKIGLEIFDKESMNDIRLDWPLTLMEADNSYLGHNIHTHFYHCPHWYFTVLFYVDGLDNESKGTTLHRIKDDKHNFNSYNSSNAGELASVALNWNNFPEPFSNIKINEQTLFQTSEAMSVEFKTNRMFAFLDGPLSFHSVDKSNQKNNKRRIMRSHVKVHHPLFYNKHSVMLNCDFDPSLYMKVCQPNAKLSEKEKIPNFEKPHFYCIKR